MELSCGHESYGCGFFGILAEGMNLIYELLVGNKGFI